MSETTPPVLRVAGLSTAFRVGGVWQTVVREVSFDIGARETLAVVGESGSGKSVTALSIMRLVSTANGRIEGRVELDGRNLLALSEEAMHDVRGGSISMIFQEPMTSLNPVLTVGFQVSESLRRHRSLPASEADREALRLFDLVRIPDAARRFKEYPHTFSGGMRQRVMIAMALAGQPKLLIADEPTTALDVTIQAQILDLVLELQREIGMSVMFITHDMGVVAEVADRVAVMWRGRKVEEAVAADLFAAPGHPYTRQLLSAVPQLGSLRGEEMPRRFPNVDLRRAEGELGAVEDAVAEPAAEPDRRGDSILEVTDLTTRFPVRGGLFGRQTGNIHAVENVSFSLRARETLALVGESGCGKSTTGRSILGLVKADRGTVRFGKDDLVTLDRSALRKVRRRLQMIFQDPYGSLNPRKTVGAALREPIVVHGIAAGSEADRRVAELLLRVGLEPEHAFRFPPRVLGRPASAHLHRAFPCARAFRSGRGRVGFGPGCLHQGAGHQSDDGAAGLHGSGVSVYQPRHRGRGTNQPPGCRNVSRRDCRNRAPGRGAG